MDSIKNIATGTILTLIIGGTAYSFSQVDVVQNFANDTGLTQEQAQQYIDEIPEEDLASWEVIGSEFITEGQDLITFVDDIDCDTYDYPWESASFSCLEGKNQIEKIGRDSLSLGQAYTKLDSDSASEDDIRETIKRIDELNADYELAVVKILFISDPSVIDETKKTNSYNKAILKAVLESAENTD
ncbi:TPA: hypothetical protein DEP58_04045 [Patescibacteria group bacterium]|nr:MAG: hypothetical protein UU98_C0005G0003 [Parcubacteria group bacterium GW2011_GWD2_42_14]HCC05446.1 hypothetical protein [Patescibacteria group bacterium]